MALRDSSGKAPFTQETRHDLQTSATQQIHTYCGEKDMYHSSQMSQDVLAALNKISVRKGSVVCSVHAELQTQFQIK